jgi:hypothetical protein
VTLEIARKRFRTKRVSVSRWEWNNFYCSSLGTTDTKNGMYIYGKTTPKHVVSTINHEMIHYVIERIIDDYVSTLLDSVDDKYWNP